MIHLVIAVLLQQSFQVPSAGAAELAGRWRFHAGDSAAWSQPAYPDSAWAPVAVPGPWPDATRGFGWYRTRVEFDAVPYAPLGIRFAGIDVAAEIYVDGEKLAAIGSFPPHYRARSGIPLVVPIPPAMLTPGTHVLAVRVYSTEISGGIVGDVELGPIDDVNSDVRTRDFMLVGTALLLLGLGQIALWVRRSEARIHGVLALLCILLALFFLVWAPFARLALAPWIFWLRLWGALGAASAAAVCYALRRLFELEDDRLLLVLGLIFVAMVPLVLFVPTWSQLAWVQLAVANPASLVLGVTAVAFSLRQRMRGAEHVAPVLLGSLVFAVGTFHDVLAGWGLVSATTYPLFWIAGCIAIVLGLVISAGYRLAEAETAALYDQLTGLYRREVVMDALQREIRRAARTHAPIAVIMMDVDRFKQINDTLGHQAGDRVLAEIGRRLGEAGRAVDWLGRYGGDEFIAVLDSTHAEGAVQACERLRHAVAALPIATGRTARTITLSAGVAAYDGGTEWPTTEQLVGAADAALYRAKDSGRNTVAT